MNGVPVPSLSGSRKARMRGRGEGGRQVPYRFDLLVKIKIYLSGKGTRVGYKYPNLKNINYIISSIREPVPVPGPPPLPSPSPYPSPPLTPRGGVRGPGRGRGTGRGRELNHLINNFENYPLLTKNGADFFLFCKKSNKNYKQ